MRDYYILGNKLTDLTLDELLAQVDGAVARGQHEVILNTNIQGILLARRLPWLKSYRNAARITHCDGSGVVLGARLLGLPVNPRLSINDFIWPMAEHCRDRGHSVYLLGAEPDVVADAAENLRRGCPGLRIAGYHHGYFEKQGPETEAVVEAINRSDADLLLVGLGMPVQERWLMENQHRLTCRVSMVVGGFYKRLSGRVPFAPAWVTRNGLEWLYLSLRDPRRFRDRYLVQNPKFLGLVLLQRLGLVSNA